MRNISSLQLKNLNTYKKAYDKIKSNPGNMTKGTDGKTLDSISLKKITKLRDSVMDWSFKFKPTRRFFIPKANGKKRPMGIPNTMDKILQTVLKDIMESELEKKVFHPKSFAFRPKRSLHLALLEIQRMVGIT